jgi:tetratricopeptide (TPR) repeat protein
LISVLVNLLGNFYVRNDLRNFEAIARSLRSVLPGDPVSLHFLGLSCYRSGRIDDAIEIFAPTTSLRQAPSRPRRKAPAAHPAASSSKALALCYREATRPESGLARAWYDLGQALLDLGQFTQAIPAFRSALIAQPASAEAMTALGCSALRAGDLAAAEDGFSRLRALQPNNRQAYLGLGLTYRRRGDFATGRACIVRARLLHAPATPASAELPAATETIDVHNG